MKRQGKHRKGNSKKIRKWDAGTSTLEANSYIGVFLRLLFCSAMKAENAGFVETKLNLSWFKSDAAFIDNKRVAVKQPLVIKQKNASNPSADSINACDPAEKVKGSLRISWGFEKC